MTDTINQAMQFKGNIILKGKIECLTGLHIGGSKEKLEIGGVDSPVIRSPRNKYPYIPGSSIKGKMRHLLEFSTGAVTMPIKKLGDVSKDPRIVRIFGIGADDSNESGLGPGRLIVRDCKPDEATVKIWTDMDSELLYTEYKPENTIDRLTSEANPRFIERVVEGSCFDFELVYGVYQIEEKDDAALIKATNEDLENIMAALRLLESSTLGKSGSRGYGHIRFHMKDPITVRVADYRDGTENYKTANKTEPKSLKELKEAKEVKSLGEITLKYTV